MFRGAGIEVGQPVNITSHPFTQVEPGVVGDLIVGFVTAECFPYPGALECSKVGIVLILFRPHPEQAAAVLVERAVD